MYVASLYAVLALKLHMWMLVDKTSTPMFPQIGYKFQHIVVVLERDNMLILPFMISSMRAYHLGGLSPKDIKCAIYVSRTRRAIHFHYAVETFLLYKDRQVVLWGTLIFPLFGVILFSSRDSTWERRLSHDMASLRRHDLVILVLRC